MGTTVAATYFWTRPFTTSSMCCATIRYSWRRAGRRVAEDAFSRRWLRVFSSLDDSLQFRAVIMQHLKPRPLYAKLGKRRAFSRSVPPYAQFGPCLRPRSPQPLRMVPRCSPFVASWKSDLRTEQRASSDPKRKKKNQLPQKRTNCRVTCAVLFLDEA